MRLLGSMLGAGLLCSLSACSFFGKVPPLSPRYFDVEPDTAPAQASGERAADVSAPRLRLSSVIGSTHLRELIAYHVSEHELGFYEERRWTERPENYMRRALARALFEERGVVNVVSGLAPALEVELTDFSELKSPTHAVRVRARVVLVDQRSVRFERTFVVEQAVARGRDDKDHFGLVPAALSSALERCVDQIADGVKAALTANAAVVSAETR